MKTINLPFQKVANPINYEKVQQLTAYDNLKSLPSTSQMTKRMSEDQFEEVLSLLESNEDVEIKG